MPLLETLLAWALLVVMVGIVSVRFWRGVQSGLHDRPLNTPAAKDHRPKRPNTELPGGMTIEDANRIVQAYAAVLQDGSSVVGRPLTDLPAPIEEIKEALLLVAKWWYDRGSLPPQRVAEFKASYGMLADFQPGGDGGFMGAVEHARRVLAAPSSTPDEKRAAVSRLAGSDLAAVEAPVTGMRTLYVEWDYRWALIVGAPSRPGGMPKA